MGKATRGYATKKAVKAAKRKAGWAQAKQAFKDIYTQDVGKTQLGEAFKGALAGAKKVNNVAGAIPGALAGLATGTIKAVPGVLKHEAQMAKGVLRGIFNDPSWYKYKGVLPIPAGNAIRPLNPVSAKPIEDMYTASTGVNKYAGSGAGVTHFINIGISFNDFRNDEAFRLAAIEAFKAIRLDLKSNLPYTQNEYDNYVMLATSVAVKAKMIEKILGSYNFTRADIPEYSKASQTVPYNWLENGIITPRAIDMISDTNYATSVNNFKKLQAIVSQIAIPRKLMEFISWWVGSQFIDQAAPNPQIYSCYLRQCPIFEATSPSTITNRGNWDIADGTVQDVIDEAMQLLNTFGIMNADIIKTGRYGQVNLVLPEEYSVVFLDDKEFFTLLVNTYRNGRTDAVYSKVFKQEYVRVDLMEELSPANSVGVANGLASWAGRSVPCSILSQAFYISTDSDIALPANIITRSNPYTLEADGAWVQLPRDGVASTDVKVYSTATATTTNATADHRFDIAGTGYTVSLSNCNLPADRRQNQITLIGATVGGVYYALGIDRTTASLYIYNGSYTTLTFSGTITNTSYGVTITAGTASVPSALNAEAAAFAGSASYWSSQAVGTTTIVVAWTTASTDTVIRRDNIQTIQWFSEQVDYHLPVIYQVSDYYYYNDSLYDIHDHVPQLVKECYIPIIMNYDNIDTVLYWMYVGLFSLD